MDKAQNAHTRGLLEKKGQGGLELKEILRTIRFSEGQKNKKKVKPAVRRVKTIANALLRDMARKLLQIRPRMIQFRGVIRPTGERRVVGCLPDVAVGFLAKRGVELASAAIAIADNDIIHALRSVKMESLPVQRWERLPSLLADPLAIYWDKLKPGLVYVLDDSEGQGKLIVLVNYVAHVNRKDILVYTVRTGRILENLSEFNNRGRYDIIK